MHTFPHMGKVENSAKKDVEVASASSSASVKLFDAWKEMIPKSLGGDMMSSDAKMECKCGKVPCECKMATEMECKCGKVPCQCKMAEEMKCKCGKVPCQCKAGAGPMMNEDAIIKEEPTMTGMI